MKNTNIITAIAVSFVLSACSMQAPPYQASIENVQTIKQAKVVKASVGKFDSNKNLESISLRGSRMYSPVGGSYGDYLSKAIEEELKLANVWTPASATVISGEMISNDIDVSGFSTGNGEASAKFVVTKEGKVIFEKVISAHHEFESSFIGAVAIPNGQSNYVNLIQKLIKNLFEDDSFISAIKS